MDEFVALHKNDAVRAAYNRVVGDHDHTERRSAEDYYSIEYILSEIRVTIPDVSLQEVCAARLEDEKLPLCPLDIESEQSHWCFKVPTGYPSDPDLIGPFRTAEEARVFADAYPERLGEAELRCMATPALTVLSEMDSKIGRNRFASKIGVPLDVLPRPPAPKDLSLGINPAAALAVKQYLERNCKLPGVGEICALLKIVAENHCIVFPVENTTAL